MARRRCSRPLRAGLRSTKRSCSLRLMKRWRGPRSRSCGGSLWTGSGRTGSIFPRRRSWPRTPLRSRESWRRMLRTMVARRSKGLRQQQRQQRRGTRTWCKSRSTGSSSRSRRSWGTRLDTTWTSARTGIGWGSCARERRCWTRSATAAASASMLPSLAQPASTRSTRRPRRLTSRAGTPSSTTSTPTTSSPCTAPTSLASSPTQSPQASSGTWSSWTPPSLLPPAKILNALESSTRSSTRRDCSACAAEACF
mmetsp:Transcript_6998/g.16249  ORF Transcript_6998/g.16249 Transcript_6998/m.16249 type:complete len:253 (+) Transcript_6998:505-1263(+)